MKQRSIRHWLRWFAVAMIMWGGMTGGTAVDVAAQLNPCIPGGPGDFTANPQNPNPTSTPLDFTANPQNPDPGLTPTAFDLTANPSPTPRVRGEIDGNQLAFFQVAGRPTAIPDPDCSDPTPTEPDDSTCVRCEPVITPTPDSCDPVVIITPDDPTPTSTTVATTEPTPSPTIEEPTVTPTIEEPTVTPTIEEPTITPTIAEPTATDVIIPQGAEIGSKLGFAQSFEDCETPVADDGSGEPGDDGSGEPGDDGSGEPGDDGSSEPGDGGNGSDSGGAPVTGLPSTGAGASGAMAALWLIVASGAGLLLCVAAWLSVKRRPTGR